MTPKIATCCYCGTRAALRLDRDRHELTCSNCGAPLHDLKRLPVQKQPQTTPRQSREEWLEHKHNRKFYKPAAEKPKRRKKRKGLLKKVFEEVWDEIEDIFD